MFFEQDSNKIIRDIHALIFTEKLRNYEDYDNCR